MSTQKLKFPRSTENILAESDKNGIIVATEWGWTVGIPKEAAIGYVKNYNSNANAGFFSQNGKVNLTHGNARLSLTEQEAAAIVALIRTQFQL